MTPDLTPEMVRERLENSTGMHWYWQPGWGLQYWKDGGLGLLIADGGEGCVTGADFALIELAQLLAADWLRQEADLLAALARAEAAESVVKTVRECGQTIVQKQGWLQTKTGGVLADTSAENARREEARRQADRDAISAISEAHKKLFDLARDLALAPTPANVGAEAGA